ncbi:MAG TPA: polysaccharide biosynthesis tyrosine autokinase [Actinomycetota bacterium]|nr:polysaccharide biosynthesis tyrosine autokinase [Actinomycetota bacterium]
MSTSTPGHSGGQTEIRETLHILWLRKWWIIIPTILIGAGSLARALTQPDVYRSTAKVLVLPVNIPEAQIETSFIFMTTELEIANSSAVAAQAQDLLNEDGLRLGSVSVTSPPDTQILDFAAFAGDPVSAQRSADAYAEAYQIVRKENLVGSVEDALDATNALIVDLSARIEDLANSADTATNAALGASFASQLEQQQSRAVALELALQTPVSRPLERASQPLRPYSPRPRRSLALGLFIGVVLSTGVALLRDRLDRRVRGRSDVEATVDAPVLGQIPTTPSLHRQIAVVRDRDAPAAEAYRALRTRVLFSASRDGFRTVMVTSAKQGEGKTATAANLAVAIAQADTRVVLVSGDLHRPGLWRYLPESGAGLADVLAGTARVRDVVVPTQHRNLTFVPSGDLEKVPEAALASADMLTVLDELAEVADMVIVDAPPVLGVADALDLASLVDRVMLIVDATMAEKDSMREAVADLRSIGAEILGVVLTRSEPGRFPGYGYGPHYGYRARNTVTSGDGDVIGDGAAATAPVGGRALMATTGSRSGAAPAPPPPPDEDVQHGNGPAARHVPPRRDARARAGQGDGAGG